MKVHSNHFGHPSKKRLIAFSCATALASFALLAKPAVAEENTDANTLPTDNTVTVGTESIQTTADLVETREVNASQDISPAPSSEQTQTATSETNSQTNNSSKNQASQTVSEESTKPLASADTSVLRSVTTTAETEPATADTVTGGHYYSDELGNWYYKDANGNNVTGDQTIDGVQVYFRSNGQQVKGDFSGESYSYPETVAYYDVHNGAKVTKEGFVQNRAGQTFYLNEKGIKTTGIREIDGNLYYFNFRETASPKDVGVLQKGKVVELEAGATEPRAYGFGTPGPITQRYYFDENTGQAVKNQFVDGYFYGPDGNSIRQNSGEVSLDGETIYLYADGRQAKNELVISDSLIRFYDNDGHPIHNTSINYNGMIYQFDENGNGQQTPNPNGYYSDDQGNWYYKNAQGENLIRAHVIDGQQVYFHDNGQQVKGALVQNGRLQAFYDVDTGQLWTNRYVQYNNNWYYLGNDGKPLKGAHTINGQEVFFSIYGDPAQVKGGFGQDGVYMPSFYYDKNTGDKVRNAFVKDQQNNIFYVTEDGTKAIGLKEIDGDYYYFQPSIPTSRYTITGALVTNQTRTINGQTYHFDADGRGTIVN